VNPAGEEYGSARLRQHMLRPEVSAEGMLEQVRSFANGAGLGDDATVILVKA
jgi:phosphoserine phosphatase RsbU/P